ncbi:MAG: hypothetical protein U1A77_06330 [Pirellulales bacterium]
MSGARLDAHPARLPDEQRNRKGGWNVEWRVTRGSAKSADLNPLRGSSDNLITGGRTVAKKAAKKAAPKKAAKKSAAKKKK